MAKITSEMLCYDNSVSRILKIHCRGWKVLAYCNDGSVVCGKVFVKRGSLYVGRTFMGDRLITRVYYSDKKNGGNGAGKEFK